MLSRRVSLIISLLTLALLWPRTASAAAPPSDGLRWLMYDTTDGLAANSVWALTVTANGEIWAGTTAGVSRWDGVRWRSYGRGHGLGDEWVTALATDRQGCVWAGTYGGGLSVWDGTEWRTLNRENSGLTNDWVTALLADDAGHVWVGTLGGGVSVWDNDTWHTYNAANSVLPRDWITALAQDAQGTIWAGVAGKGLCALGGISDRCYDATHSSLGNDNVHALAVTDNGCIWIGTDAGLYAYDPAAETWWLWPDGWNLPHPRVRALAVDAAGRLWAGTGKGVAVYDAAAGAWRAWTAWDGVQEPVIGALAAAPTGDIWAGTLGQGLARYGEGGETPRPTRYPVVLVHGWRGPESDRVEDSEFQFLARWLERDGIPAFYAEGIHPDNTLHENARHLQAAIAKAEAATGAESVDIIAFSMGGLNTRAYLESALYAGDVRLSFIMGTPHEGVQLWKTFLLHEIAHWSDEPSARELLPEHIALFNATHANNWEVPYYLVAGAVAADELPPLFGFLPPSDGLISARSAHALSGPAIRYITTSDLHAWSAETILLEIPSFLYPAATYRTHLRQMLQEGSGLPGSAVPPAWEPLPDENHSPLLHGILLPGQRITTTLEIERRGTVRIYARGQAEGLSLTLTTPDGRHITPDSADDEDVSYFALPLANFQSYVLTDTRPGTWQLHLEAEDSLAEACGYAMYAVLDSPLRLDVMPTAEGRLDAPILIQAMLRDGARGIAAAQVRVEIYPARNVPVTISLYDDGQHGDGAADDGHYANWWTPGGDGGYYPIFVSAHGTYAGQAFGRGDEGVLVISPETASFSDGPSAEATDADGDGQYEALRVEVPVRAQEAGEYLLAARLVDAAGAEIARAATPVALVAGEQRVTLAFAGAWIRRHKADGPYRIEKLTLVDARGAAIKVDETGGITTKAYPWRAFTADSRTAGKQ